MANPFIKGYIVSEQPRKSVLGAHVNTFMSVVSDLGYSPSTIRTQLTAFEKPYEMGRKKIMSLFLISMKASQIVFYPNLVARERFVGVTIKPYIVFLIHLRVEGAIPHPEPTFNESPLTQLKSRYENYL